ncbi:hypothetical protein [Lentzea californiensis]|uniref:hypothetical protein n=1 Tax=Lentzea californiensis TaxID=438851 RepID=UPI00216675B8|nr:hypothetical protein [Lentzea californiensis]MCR3752132.1 hypothetical protein [Lentzea californiensis]
MATKPCPGRRAVVTYLNPDVMHPSVFVHGVVIGAHVVDPQTSHTWVPIMQPDCTVSVLDTSHIISVRHSELR